MAAMQMTVVFAPNTLERSLARGTSPEFWDRRAKSP
jgi:hypothetical protein